MSGMMTKVWGPACWFYLHCMVTGYPDKIDTKNKDHILRRKHIIKFLQELPYVLPCKYCRESFIQFSEELPVENYANSNKDLCRWLYKMHTKVNDKLGISDQPTFAQTCLKFNKFKAVCNKTKKGCIANAKSKSQKCILNVETISPYEQNFNELTIKDIHNTPQLFIVPQTINKKKIYRLAKIIMKSKDQVLLVKLHKFLQDIMDQEQKKNRKKEWLVYGSESCPYCRDAKEYMRKNRWDFEYREISDVDPDEMRDIYKIVKKSTIPIIFKLKGKKYKYIGGFSDIKQFKKNKF